MPRCGRELASRLSRIKSFGVYQYGERGSIGNAELPVNVVEVDLHGALGQPEPSPDFLVGYTFGEHEHDLAFAGRERCMRTNSSFCYFQTDLPGGVYTKPMAPTARSSY